MTDNTENYNTGNCNTGDRLEDIEMMTSGTKDGDPIDLSLSYWY